MRGIRDNSSDPICSQLPAWHLPCFLTLRHNGGPAKGETSICSIQVSWYGNQPDGKSLVRPHTRRAHTARDQSLVQGPRWRSCLERKGSGVWGWEGKAGFICILVFEF